MLAEKIRSFIADESGATAIEYGLIAALIAVAVIGTFVAVGNSIINLFDTGTAEVLNAQTDKI